MHFIQLLLPAIEHFHIIGYWIALFVALLETTIGVGLFIPGSTTILFMGALAGRGYFDLGDLLWFAAIGAIIGDNINYFIGRKYGSVFFIQGFWFIKPEHFKKGEEFFNRHGVKSIFIGRFIPSMKEVVPLIAGTFKMKRLSFMIWNILGAIGWSLIWILSGYFFAQSLDMAKIWLTRAGFFVAVLLALFFIFYILKIFFIRKGKDFFSFLFSLFHSIWLAIIQNNKVQKFVQKHHNLFLFLGQRLNKKKFSGLSLTLFSLAIVYLLFLFSGIIENILASETIVFADVRIANLLILFRNNSLIKFFFWITLLGKWPIILIFTIATVLILWLFKKQIYIISLFLSIIGSEIFTIIGKLIFHRARPSGAVYLEKSFSFPSGHATIAMAFYGFIIYVLMRNVKYWRRKINIFFLGFLLIILIGFSRLYLGVHYVSDIWGGYLVGAIWLVVAISFSEYFLFKKQENKISSIRRKKFIAWVIIFCSILFYIFFALNYSIPTVDTNKIIKQTETNKLLNIFDSDQVKYTETLLGNRQEPISFIIVAKNNQEILTFFNQAGWRLADKINMSSIIKMIKAVLLKKEYLKAPITPDFWNSQVNDFGFEKLVSTNNFNKRHHARFWKTNYITENKKSIYIGIASFDNGLKWGITHHIDPDIDTERKFLFNDLEKTGLIKSIKKEQFVRPKIGNNFSGDLFFTDGKVYIIYTK